MSKFENKCISLITGQEWIISKAIIEINDALYLKAIEQSKMKSQYTMVASQSGGYRNPELKFQRQFMGTLAEIYAKVYLEELVELNNLTNTCKIIRYDDIRTDGFKSPENEFDIKIQNLKKMKDYTVESRSSIARDRDLKSAIEAFDIIGPYSSIAKRGEKMNDLYIRPLYEFIPYTTHRFLPSEFQSNLEAGEINLYFIGGCSKEDMYRKGNDKSMNQGSTSYRVVKMTEGDDMKNFRKKTSLYLM